MRLLRAPANRFLLASSFLIAAFAILMRTRLFAMNPDVVAWGITFDLTITIPLLYWFFVVRAGKAAAITIAPLFVVCTLIASRIIPAPHQAFARDLGRFAVPLAEVALIATLLYRMRKGSVDSRVLQFVQAELAILHYAFAGWRRKPEPVPGRAITFHERSGWNVILVCIFALIAAEGLAMHLFLARYTKVGAWGWTALDLWAVVWLLGDYHALRLRRSVLTADSLLIRLGMRWAVDVPLSSIASIREARSEKDWKRRDVLRLAMVDEPRWLVTLREPLVAKGLAGFTREIHGIAMLPDDDEAITALRLAISESTPHDAPATPP